MKNKINERQIVQFNSAGVNPDGEYVYSLFYQRTPTVDEMFTVERLSSSPTNWFYFGVGWSESEILGGNELSFDYTAYESDFMIPAGQTMNFYVQTDVDASGEFLLNFYPATDKSTPFALPSGSGQRVLLTTVTANTYETFTLSMLGSSGYPITVELERPDNTVVGSFQFDSANNQYPPSHSVWSGNSLEFTMQPGESYNFYAINNTPSGSNVQGSFLLQLRETQSDYVDFSLPADTIPRVVYSRISPTQEYVGVVQLEKATALPVTLEIYNGTRTITHVFTSSGESWNPETDFILEFSHESTFTLINSTNPLVECSGNLVLYFNVI